MYVSIYVFPHYKFNLTNGSENLETMEYMKCGRVYHADGGDAGWYRRQYCQGRSIFSESAAARREGRRGSKARGKGARVVPRQDRAGESSKTCSWHDKKSRAEVDARFLSHSNRVQTPRINTLPFLPKTIFAQGAILGPFSRKFNSPLLRNRVCRQLYEIHMIIYK